jgi:hypothetical protein
MPRTRTLVYLAHEVEDRFRVELEEIVAHGGRRPGQPIVRLVAAHALRDRRDAERAGAWPRLEPERVSQLGVARSRLRRDMLAIDWCHGLVSTSFPPANPLSILGFAGIVNN